MTEMELYKLWCEKAVDDPDLQTELKSIEGDEAAIQDRFYRDLEFGTGGLRGVIGADGTDRRVKGRYDRRRIFRLVGTVEYVK